LVWQGQGSATNGRTLPVGCNGGKKKKKGPEVVQKCEKWRRRVFLPSQTTEVGERGGIYAGW